LGVVKQYLLTKTEEGRREVYIIKHFNRKKGQEKRRSQAMQRRK
jgi:hypothetical protein